jgi:hypothetical protein
MKYAKRKTMALYEKEMEFLEVLNKKNQNNFSKSIRECIEFTCHAIEQTGSIERAKEILYFNQTNDLRVNDKIILRVEKVIKTGISTPDIVPEGAISELYGYGNKIFERLEEKIRKNHPLIGR